MMRQGIKTDKSSQEIQDRIFLQMTADEKLKVGSMLWKLGKEIAGEKINYGFDELTTGGRIRSETSTRQNRKDS